MSTVAFVALIVASLLWVAALASLFKAKRLLDEVGDINDRAQAELRVCQSILKESQRLSDSRAFWGPGGGAA